MSNISDHDVFHATDTPLGIYGVINTVFTLPAVFLLDRVGRRPLLMAGAVGCFVSLLVVGSCIAGTGGDFEANPMAGHVAIGTCMHISTAASYTDRLYSLRLYLRCEFQL